MTLGHQRSGRENLGPHRGERAEVEVEAKEANINMIKEEIPISIVVEELQEDDPFEVMETEACGVTTATRSGIMHVNARIDLLIENKSLII